MAMCTRGMWESRGYPGHSMPFIHFQKLSGYVVSLTGGCIQVGSGRGHEIMKRVGGVVTSSQI